MRRLALVTLIVLIVLPGPATRAQDPTPAAYDLATVIRIVDGDAIVVVMAGAIHRVRYIGIDTPEADEVCGDAATAANAGWSGGEVVMLVRDVSETDRYGRLLRYVYVDDTFVNATLVAEGWAEAMRYPPDTAFADTFGQLEAEARAAGLGCHQTGAFGTTTSTLTPTPHYAVTQLHATMRALRATGTQLALTLSALSPTSTAPPPLADPPVAAVNQTAYLYELPGRTQIGILGPGVPVLILAQTDEIGEAYWFFVDLEDGRRGYVRRRVLNWEGAVSLPTLAADTLTPPWNCTADLYNCLDFAGRCADLDAYWRACPGDSSHLDGNQDGRPCESICPS